MQDAADNTRSTGICPATEEYECSSKRAKFADRCEEYSSILYETSFLRFPTVCDDFKNLCEALNLKNRCIYGLGAKAMELQAKAGDHEKRGAATKGNLKCFGEETC